MGLVGSAIRVWKRRGFVETYSTAQLIIVPTLRGTFSIVAGHSKLTVVRFPVKVVLSKHRVFGLIILGGLRSRQFVTSPIHLI